MTNRLLFIHGTCRCSLRNEALPRINTATRSMNNLQLYILCAHNSIVQRGHQ